MFGTRSRSRGKSSKSKGTESKVLFRQCESSQILVQAADVGPSKWQRRDTRDATQLATLPAGPAALISRFLEVNERLCGFALTCKHLRAVVSTRAAWTDVLSLTLPLPALR